MKKDVRECLNEYKEVIANSFGRMADLEIKVQNLSEEERIEYTNKAQVYFENAKKKMMNKIEKQLAKIKKA